MKQHTHIKTKLKNNKTKKTTHNPNIKENNCMKLEQFIDKFIYFTFNLTCYNIY